MSPQITYRPGQPQTFIATRTFDLGNTNMKAVEGQQIDFDGTLITMPGYPPISMPQLRGAIKIGWLVPVAEYNPNDISAKIPQPAGVQMRPADGGNPMNPAPRHAVNTAQVDHEEREVMNVNRHAAAARQRNLTNYRRDDIRQGRENMAVRPGEAAYVIEEQDGRVVRGLQTPAVQDVNVMRAGEAIARAANLKVQAGQAPSREDMMAAMTPEQRESYLLDLEANKAQHYMGNQPQQPYQPQMLQPHSQVVAHVQSPQAIQHGGINVQGSVGGGTEIADMGGTGHAGAAQQQVIEEGCIKFTTTNGPKKGVRMVPKQPAVQLTEQDDALCRKIAKAVCPDFPDNYVFTDPIRKKIARLQADYDDRPDVIRAVAAAENDMAVKTRLVEEFPHVFA